MTTLVGLALFTLISIGIRLLMMFTIQQRRERMNRQINERLRTLIAAYKVLGGSFTGNLSVDPTHLRDVRLRSRAAASGKAETEGGLDASGADDETEVGDAADEGSERQRRIRDAVEAALSDIILLGTEEQVRLAQRAVGELVAGRRVETHDLVVSLRDFIRVALDLAPVPADLPMPRQGPARPSSGSGRGGGRGEGGNAGGGRGGGAGGGMGGGMGGGGMGSADDAGGTSPAGHHL
ncbi:MULTISPECIES: hypothetical protein [unclassified Mesorhizobium]|uniref:hypothetical protein n=1 Tax=Mesorhizobium sp. Root554 TaxID=1736557 RepID=UPI001FCDB75A|nr:MULTISPECIES: hypothetical protein [unclassified Mesorhizobium]